MNLYLPWGLFTSFHTIGTEGGILALPGPDCATRGEACHSDVAAREGARSIAQIFIAGASSHREP